jgi:hypothetical protein
MLGGRMSVEGFLLRFSALWFFECLVLLFFLSFTFVVLVLLVLVTACFAFSVPYAGESN